jgi:hypothetical protein
MFKHAALAAAAATAFVAAPASAAVVINKTITLDQFGTTFIGGTQDNVFSSPDPLFELNYTFTLPVDAAGRTQVSTITFSGSSVTFSAVKLNGSSLTLIESSGGSQVYRIQSSFLAGFPNLLEVDGTVASGAARIGTELNISAVPEPTTWAMFILGFGILGSVMRRRSSKVGVAKASLTFA